MHQSTRGGMVDALDLGSSSLRSGGSSPFVCTNIKLNNLIIKPYFGIFGFPSRVIFIFIHTTIEIIFFKTHNFFVSKNSNNVPYKILTFF